MKATIFAVLVLFINSAFAQQCNCLEYPYRPSPPCPEMCFKALVNGKPENIDRVKNLDPGVSVHLRVLANRPDRESIDFKGITSKRELEALSLKSIESGKVRIGPN